MRSPFIHLLVAIAISIAVISGYAVWYTTVSQKSSEVAGLQNQIVVASEYMNRISYARAALAEIAGDEKEIQGYFVSEEGVVSFINNIETFGVDGATVKVVSVSKSVPRALPTLLLALSVDGTFDAVMRTVGAIEYAPYAISVLTVGVARGEGDRWHADINITVDSAPSANATSTPRL